MLGRSHPDGLGMGTRVPASIPCHAGCSSAPPRTAKAGGDLILALGWFCSSHSSSVQARGEGKGQQQLVVCRETQQLLGRYLVYTDIYSMYSLGVGYLGMFLGKHGTVSDSCRACTQSQHRSVCGHALIML